MRQINSTLALFDNYSNALDYQTEMLNSTGLAQDRYNKYLQGAEAAGNRAATAWQGVWSATINSKALIFLDNVTAGLGNVINKMGGLLSFNALGPIGWIKALRDTIADVNKVIPPVTSHLTENTEAIKAQASPLFTNTELIKEQGRVASGTGENLDYLTGVVNSLATEMEKLTNAYDANALAAEQAATSMQKNGEISVEEEKKVIDAGYESAIMTDTKTGKLTVNVSVLHALVVAEGVATAASLQSALNDAIRINATQDVIDKLTAELDVQNALNIAMGKNATLVIPTYGVASGGGGPSLADQQKKQLDDMISKIKDEQNAEKDLLNTQKDRLTAQLDAYTKIIDARKALLTSQQKEIDYLDTLAEKEKSVSSIQNELAALALDNSEEANAKRLTLQSDLATKQSDLEKTQTDHSFQIQQDALDAQLATYKEFIDIQKAMIDAQLSMIDAYLKNVVQLTADALKRLGQQTGQNPPASSSAASVTWSDTPTTIGAHMYSSGGEVSGGTPGMDSVSSRLTPGEYVLRTDAVKNIGIPALNALNRGMPSTKALGGGGGLTVGTLMNIEVAGNLDKSVVPDIKRIADGVMAELNKTLHLRGYVRTTNQSFG